MLALITALVAPYFIDWDAYRADFEKEATRILGQPVTVAGKAKARLLPFPSVTVASRNDEFCAFEVAERMAADWGSLFLDAGESGHINAESGHGPWPEGLMVFSKFMNHLKPPNG